MLSQGSKLKKFSGCFLATNWRNTFTRGKFLVASLNNVNDTAHSQGFWYFARLQSSEIHKTTQNTAKFGRNLIKFPFLYNIFETSQLLGLFTCRKLVNLSWNFITETCNNVPKLHVLAVDYVAKSWALAMMLCHWFSSGAYCCWKSKWWPLLEKH